ncbi:MAG TPA: hypothetical protein VFQ85_18140 [Mycobacteriales bacterium]|nr:hypothetical protein [Mycobacteriales bacterium]
MTPDVVEAGRERRPLGRAVSVAATVALAVLATGGLLQSRHEPRRVTATPTPTAPAYVPPLATREVNPDIPLYGIEAPPYRGAFRFTVATPEVLRSGRTGATPASEDPPQGWSNAMLLPMGRGWVLQQEGETGGRLLLDDGGGERATLPAPGLGVVAAARPGEFWIAYPGSPVRYDLAGHRLGSATLPASWELLAGTAAGLLVTDDHGTVRVVDERGRRVRALPGHDAVVGVGARSVAFADPCGHPCPPTIVDVRTGQPWASFDPMGDADARWVRFAPGDVAAAVIASTSVYVVRPDGGTFRAAFSNVYGLDATWVDDHRLCVTQQVANDLVVYEWDLVEKTLRHAATYHLGEVVGFAAAPLN